METEELSRKDRKKLMKEKKREEKERIRLEREEIRYNGRFGKIASALVGQLDKRITNFLYKSKTIYEYKNNRRKKRYQSPSGYLMSRLIAPTILAVAGLSTGVLPLVLFGAIGATITGIKYAAVKIYPSHNTVEMKKKIEKGDYIDNIKKAIADKEKSHLLIRTYGVGKKTTDSETKSSVSAPKVSSTSSATNRFASVDTDAKVATPTISPSSLSRFSSVGTDAKKATIPIVDPIEESKPIVVVPAKESKPIVVAPAKESKPKATSSRSSVSAIVTAEILNKIDEDGNFLEYGVDLTFNVPGGPKNYRLSASTLCEYNLDSVPVEEIEFVKGFVRKSIKEKFPLSLRDEQIKISYKGRTIIDESKKIPTAKR